MSVSLSRWIREWREASMSRNVVLGWMGRDPEAYFWASREANLLGTLRRMTWVYCNAPCRLRRSQCTESYGWSAPLLLLSRRKRDSLDRTPGTRLGLECRASGKPDRTRLLSRSAEAGSTEYLHSHLRCPRCASRTTPVPRRGPSQS